MNELTNTKFFSLLTAPSQEVTNEEMQNAYGCFKEQLRTVSQSEQSYANLFRTLNVSRIELTALQTLHRYEQKKKCA